MPKVAAAFSVLCFEDQWLNSIPPGSKLANLHYLLLLSPLLTKNGAAPLAPIIFWSSPEPRINDLLLLRSSRSCVGRGARKVVTKNQTNSVIKCLFLCGWNSWIKCPILNHLVSVPQTLRFCSWERQILVRVGSFLNSYCLLKLFSTLLDSKLLLPVAAAFYIISVCLKSKLFTTCQDSLLTFPKTRCLASEIILRQFVTHHYDSVQRLF